ncbi:4-coumarate-CoA ligase [Apiospora arundinis]
MSGEKKPTPGVSSRRSACDRCRGQKLRCLRKGGDAQGRCDRCAKADTACTTSPIYRMRNYSVDDDGSSVSRRRRRTADRSSTYPPQSPRIVAAASSTLAPPSNSPASAPALPDSLTMSPAAQTTPTTAGAAAQTFVWHFEDVMQGSNNNGGGAAMASGNFAMAPPPPDWTTFPDPATTQAFSTPVVTSADVWDHHDLTMAHLYVAENADKNTNTSFNSPVGGDDPMPQHTYAATHPHQTLQLQQPHTPDGIHWSSHLTPQQEQMTDYFTPEHTQSPCLMHYQPNEPESESHNHMQMLTNINLDLATQLKQVTQPHINLRTLISPSSGNSDPSSNTVLESILNLTQEFLHILDVISGAPNTPLPTPAIPTTSWSTGTSYGGGYTSGSENASSISAYDESDMNSPSDSSGITHYASPASSSNMSPPPPSAATITGFSHGRSSSPSLTTRTTDPAAVLLMITCYVHVLRIYVALFWHIQQHLQRAVANPDERAIDQFGSFPLQSGNLQVAMVIKLVTNTFERMEATLGLPSELCLGGGGSSSNYYNNNTAYDNEQQQQLLRPNNHYHHHEGGGMLGDEGLLDVARTIISKEDAGRPEEGKGGIRSLRRDIMQARHLLRGYTTS